MQQVRDALLQLVHADYLIEKQRLEVVAATCVHIRERNLDNAVDSRNEWTLELQVSTPVYMEKALWADRAGLWGDPSSALNS